MKIGILGGGQLGRMLALAGTPLGFRFVSYDPSPDAPAAEVSTVCVGEFTDPAQLSQFARMVDVITYEFENIDASAIELCAQITPVFPPPEALRIGQDRVREKRLFLELEIPTARFFPIASPAELQDACAQLGLPAILKTVRMGYDGKGQHRLMREEDLTSAWSTLNGSPLIVEQLIPFERELSIIGVRTAGGECQFYPLTENLHRDGILRVSRAPATNTEHLQPVAEDYARRIMGRLNYVGVFALELFEHRGQLLANEMAPRVHNSGHWTQNGSECSQFENHIRAITGLPLGDTTASAISVMVNLIGEAPPLERLLTIPHLHAHLYRKAPRPGRKIGHLNITAADHATVERSLEAVQTQLRAQ